MSERNLANELWEHRNDPDEWDEEAVEIEVRPRRSSVVSFRLPSEELDEVERAATSSGETVSEFIRNALRIRLRGMATGPIFGITFANGPDQISVHSDVLAAYKAGRTEASYGSSYGFREPWLGGIKRDKLEAFRQPAPKMAR